MPIFDAPQIRLTLAEVALFKKAMGVLPAASPSKHTDGVRRIFASGQLAMFHREAICSIFMPGLAR